MYSVLNMSDLRNVKFLNHKAFVNDVYANGFHDESDFAICFAMEHGDSMLAIPMLEYLEMSHKVHGFHRRRIERVFDVQFLGYALLGGE